MVSSAAADNASEDNSELDSIKNIRAYDAYGSELSSEAGLNKETGEIKFSGESNTLTYDYDTGFENKLMKLLFRRRRKMGRRWRRKWQQRR